MEQFIQMSDLLTFGTLVTVVFGITNFTKELRFIKKIPTKYWSWLIALALIISSNIYNNTFTYWNLIVYPISAMFVSLSANGMASFNNKKEVVESVEEKKEV